MSQTPAGEPEEQLRGVSAITGSVITATPTAASGRKRTSPQSGRATAAQTAVAAAITTASSSKQRRVANKQSDQQNRAAAARDQIGEDTGRRVTRSQAAKSHVAQLPTIDESAASGAASSSSSTGRGGASQGSRTGKTSTATLKRSAQTAAPLAPQTEGSAAANPFLADQLQQQILLDAALAASLQRQQQVQHLQADVFGAVSSGSAQQVAAAHSITGNPASLSAVAANTGSCASNQAASSRGGEAHEERSRLAASSASSAHAGLSSSRVFPGTSWGDIPPDVLSAYGIPSSAHIGVSASALQNAYRAVRQPQLSVIQQSGVSTSRQTASHQGGLDSIGSSAVAGSSSSSFPSSSGLQSSSTVAAVAAAYQQHQLQFQSSMLLESMAQAQSAAVAAAAVQGGAHNRGRAAAASFLGNIVPRMQHLLGAGSHRETHTNNARMGAILDGLRSTNDIRQSEAAAELAEQLLMGNEDSLPQNMPIKELIASLISILQGESNYELVLTAARCLTNMLEALPRSQPIILEAVPYLLEKLKRIECIDVAEQSLTALEVMSRRNGKVIMIAGGIAATIAHIDFFSRASQRLAFQIAANCALYVSHADFPLVRDSLPELTQRLLIEDKRCLDSICLLFSRLVENLRGSPDKLREIAGQNHRLAANIQQLLLAHPTLLSAQTFPLVIKILRQMASRCSDIAVALVHMHFASTLRSLFVSQWKTDEPCIQIDIVSRPPNQLTELVHLTGELFPRLPTTGIFEVDTVVASSRLSSHDAILQPLTATWHWKDEEGGWQQYRTQESRQIEAVKQVGGTDLHIPIGQHLFYIDLVNMRQLNEITGIVHEIQRRAVPTKKDNESKANEEDKRLELLQNEPEKMEFVIRQLFPVLVEIDGSSSGPALRYESLRVMLRMVCPMSATVLRSVLADLPLSGHIASALASPRSKDLCIVVAALQLVHLLLEKLSDVYAPLFRKEGVAHEVAKLANIHSALGTPSVAGGSKSAPPSGVGSPSLGNDSPGGSNHMTTRSHRSSRTGTSKRTSVGAAALLAAADASLSSSPATSGEPSSVATPPQSATNTPASRNRHRKRTSPDSGQVKTEKSRRKSSSSNFLSSIRLPSFRAASSAFTSSPSGANTTGSSGSSGGSPSIDQIVPPNVSITSLGISSNVSSPSSSSRGRANLASNSGMASSSAGLLGSHSSSSMAALQQNCPLTLQQKEKLRFWIRKEAEMLVKTYLCEPSSSCLASHADLLEAARSLSDPAADCGVEPLQKLFDVIEKDNVSAFELKHSGVMEGLHKYLSDENYLITPRKMRIRRFLRVFAKIDSENVRPTGIDGCFSVFEMLIHKVVVSISQLEQFQVTDMSGIATSGAGGCLRGAQALRFFQSHQIRVDPLTSISAIERYLIERGVYIRSTAQVDDSSGEDELSDEDGEGVLAGSPHTGSEDRRLEIVIGENAIPGHVSILQALRQYSPVLAEEAANGGAIGQSLWLNTHTLYYRAVAPTVDNNAAGGSTNSAVAGPSSASLPPALIVQKDKKHKVSEKLWIDGDVDPVESALWGYLTEKLTTDVEDPCVPSVLLLRALYGINRFWHTVFDEHRLPSTYAPLLPQTVFHCTKLTSKLSRQLSDFLTVATQQIPKWTTEIVRAVPFMFPFMLRRSLLYCTAFGRERALMHLVNQTDGGGAMEGGEGGRGLTPRLERKKVSIRRDDLLKSAETALASCAGQRALLEVSFDGEAGTGFGPTLEFYSTISKELQLASLKLWGGEAYTAINDEGVTGGVEYISAPAGLYPVPIGPSAKSSHSTRIKKFETVGRLMAQSLVDARMIDLPLSPLFLCWLLGDQNRLGLPELETLDPTLYQSLRKLTLSSEDEFVHMEQYFTLPGNESFELLKGGKNRPVVKSNSMQFVKLVARWRLKEGVTREMEAVRRGFLSIVDASQLAIFTPDELEQLFCGCPNDPGEKIWGEPALAAAIKPDHGYSHESDQIKWLLRMLASFEIDKQRKFVQFVTGSPRLPVGGFRALNPPLTVVRKSPAYGSSDEELPSAMTCYNYLKVPAYSSYEVFRERFSVALRYVYSFHLT